MSSNGVLGKDSEGVTFQWTHINFLRVAQWPRNFLDAEFGFCWGALLTHRDPWTWCLLKFQCDSCFKWACDLGGETWCSRKTNKQGIRHWVDASTLLPSARNPPSVGLWVFIRDVEQDLLTLQRSVIAPQPVAHGCVWRSGLVKIEGGADFLKAKIQ